MGDGREDDIDWFDIQLRLPSLRSGHPDYERWLRKAAELAQQAMWAPTRRIQRRKDWQNIIQVVEEAFGADLDPDLIAGIFRMHSGQLDLFVDAYLEYRAHSQGSLVSSPKQDSAHIRPHAFRYLSYSPDRSARVYHSWTRPSVDPFAFLDRLRFLLLYCHGVAIDNPLIGLADESQEWQPGEPPQMPHWTEADRLRLASYLTFIFATAPLIRQGILVLLEAAGSYAQVSPTSELERAARRSAESFQTIKDFWSTPGGRATLNKIRANGSSRANGRRSLDDLAQALIEISDDLALLNASEGRIDLYLPFDYYQRLLRLVADKAVMVGTTSIRDRQLGVLTDLVSANVPDLDPTVVSVADIVSIRSSEQVFDRWRAELTAVASELAHLNEELIDKEDARRVAIRNELSGAANQLRTQLKRNRSLPWKILRRLTLGAIIKAPFIPVDPVSQSADLAADVANATLDLLDFYARAGIQREQAYYHHYLVFAPYIPSLESDRRHLTSQE